MPSLFDPIEIQGLTLANRAMRSATWEGMAHEDGRSNDRLVDLLVELARGGIGLIITGFTYVQWSGQGAPHMLGAHCDSLLPELTAMARRVHAAGGKIALQTVHCGGRSRTQLTGEQPTAPSAGPDDLYPDTPREMTRAEIDDMIQAFGDAARRAREAGFDAVQIHCAHGFLLNQFLSTRCNRRTDDCGGSLENRARPMLETLRRMRESVGDDFPILVKINGQDHIDGGLVIDDTVRICRWLCEAGIDAIEVSGGTAVSGDLNPVRENIDSPEREAYFRPEVRRIREAVTCPVIQVGGMRSVEVINDVLESGDADMISLCRPLIGEPDLIDRWRGGDLTRSHCISCNKCFGPAGLGKGLRCVGGAPARRAGRDI